MMSQTIALDDLDSSIIETATMLDLVRDGRLVIPNLEQKIAISNLRHERMAAAVKRFRDTSDLPDHVRDQMARLHTNRSTKQRILVLYYGGTLGMVYNEIADGVKALVPSNDTERLLSPLREHGLDDKMSVVWMPILEKPIDSTNGRWPHWMSIANAIELLYDHFDGFVVAGGTDTMDYLLSGLNFVFPNIGKPVIGAAAQKPVGSWGEDAIKNLMFSLSAACEDLSGCHLAFYDVLRDGLHVFKVKDKGYDAFDGPKQHELGRYEDGDVKPSRNVEKRKPYIEKKNLHVRSEFRDGMTVEHINPFGAAESLLHKAKDPFSLATIVLTYGAGNVRDVKMWEDEATHVDAIKVLHGMRYPLILGSPMQDGRVDSPYESGTMALLAGAVSGGNTTGSTLPVKISRCLALAWDPEKGYDYRMLREYMYKNHVGEFDENIKDRMLEKK